MRYPKEIVTCVEKDTFYMEERFSLPATTREKEEEEEAREWNREHPDNRKLVKKTNPPLMIFQPSAGFKCTVINENRQPSDATILVGDMSNVIVKSKIMYEEEMKHQMLGGKDPMQELMEQVKAMKSVPVFSHGPYAGREITRKFFESDYDKAAMKDYWQELKAEAKTNPACEKELNAIRDASRAEIANVDLAYSVKMSMGTGFRGLTPADYLTQNPANRDAFIRQLDYIKKQAEKPGNYQAMNQKQAKAMTAALQLFDAGKLGNKQSGKSAVVLYESSTKINPYTSGTRPDGKHHCSRMMITWTVGDPRPVCVEIETFYADIKRDDKGLFQFVGSTIDSRIVNRKYMTADFWNFQVCRVVDAAIQSYLTSNMPRARQMAMDAERKNIEAAKQSGAA